VCYLSAEQVRAHASNRATSATSHSDAEMGEHIDGLHHWLPKVQGKDYIYVVVDKLTKFSYFYAIPIEYNAVQVAELFFKEVFRLHGLSRNIISDTDIRFIGTFWRELFKLVGTELTPNTIYHPQTDGKTKIVNKWVEGYLSNYVGGQQRTFRRALLQHHFPHVHWYDTFPSILRV
jgi:hypothetical protein